MPLQTPSTRSYFTASKPCHQRGLKLLDRCENDSIIGWRRETGENWPYFSATFYRLVVINSREPVHYRIERFDWRTRKQTNDCWQKQRKARRQRFKSCMNAIVIRFFDLLIECWVQSKQPRM